MSPILFYGVPQGCSFGSIVALEWLGQPYRLCRIEMLQHPWPAAFGRINPMFQTPALLTADGRALSESLAILQHIGSQGVGQGLGHAQGTPGFDRLNQVLAFLNTDFFAAFGPLWLAYEREDLDEGKKALLRELGAEAVRKCFGVLDGELAGRAWLAGEHRSVADAYLLGVARWAEYHRLFDLAAEYPNVGAHLRKLCADPAAAFADAIERKAPASSVGAFQGHVSLDEALRELR